MPISSPVSEGRSRMNKEPGSARFNGRLTPFTSRVTTSMRKTLCLIGSGLKATLRHIANNTTIHGITDAYRGNWISRAFFIFVFIFCFTAMIFQLKGIFHGYLTEAVGTRAKGTGTSDAGEIPSIYYCNKNWLPMVEALRHFNYSDPTVPDAGRYKECVHGANLGQWNGTEWIERSPDDCKQYLEYWKDMLKQHIVNSILSPLEHEINLYLYRLRRPLLSCKDGWHPEDFVKDLAEQLINKHFIQWRNGKSLKESVQEYILNSIFNEVMFASGLRNKNQSVDDTNFNKTVSFFTESKTGEIAGQDSKTGEVVGPRINVLTEREGYMASIQDETLDRKLTKETRGIVPGYETSTWLFGSGSVNKTTRYWTLVPPQFDIDGRISSREWPTSEGLHSLKRRKRKILKGAKHRISVPRFSLSLDGLCWEHPIMDQSHTANQIGGNRHFVVHLGSMAYQMRKLIERKGAVENGTRKEWSEVDWNALHPRRRTAIVKRSLMSALNFARAIRYSATPEYSTQVAASKNSEPVLYFKQKVRMAGNPLVVLMFWKKTNVYLNRRAWRCKAAPWTALDQAHCNQRQSHGCETYLPASATYPETQISHDTCIYDYTDIFKDLLISLKDPKNETKFTPAHGAFGSINRRWRPDVIANLTNNNRDCPQPCTKTEFVYQISYPTATINDIGMCHRELALRLTPTIYRGKDLVSDKWFRYAFASIIETFGWQTPHCSVLEYEYVESLDQISEEYFLHGLPDLAANLGGTLGLWIGASVISFVQMIYLCCLKKLFKRTSRKVRFWRTGRLPAPGSGQ